MINIRWIWSDLYIAYKIPELRRPIAKAYSLRMARNIACVPTLVLVLPLALIDLTTKALNKLCRILTYPYARLRQATDDAYMEAHAIMSVEEIRLHAYGEEPAKISLK